jgi:nitroreductase
MLEAIRDRRSIRKYKAEPVSLKMMEALVRAAMQAPTARNLQPWEFVVTSRQDVLDRIPEYHPHAVMARSAGGVILVCGNLNIQPNTGYLIQDCSAAVQNILLEAVNQGLGAVWLGIYPREERMAGMTELFGLPSHILPAALVSVGFPGEEKPFEDRFDEKRMHTDRWLTVVPE